MTLLQLVRGDEEGYTAGEKTEGLFDSLARDVPEGTPRIRFTDVARQSGLVFDHFPAKRTNRLPEDMGSGVALGDVDGDGWTDVFACNLAGPLGESPEESGRSRLFLGGPGGRFEDATETSGIDLVGLYNAAAFLDHDSDGDLDLFVAGYDSLKLLRNEDGARFTDVSATHGLERFEGFWTGVAVGDHDGNGAPDVYVCGYVRWTDGDPTTGGPPSQYGRVIPASINPSAFEPERNLLFQGTGDGKFREVAVELGVDDSRGRGLGALFCDLDDDGLQDIYVANDVSDNALFLGRPDGTFVDRTAQAQLGDYRGAMGLAAGDYDGDQDLDLFVTHWVSQENALYTQHRPSAEAEDRASRFFDDANRLGLGHVALDRVGWATEFLDYDNDGWLDLYVVNGSTIPLEDDPARLEPMRSQLFWHRRGDRGFFHEVGAVSGTYFRETHVGRGAASLDADLDGDADLVVVHHGEPLALLRNDGGNEKPSLRVRLRQPHGNRFALGARVLLTADGRTRLEVIGAQGSYLSQRAVGEVTFGLGDATLVDELRVVWPDGSEERSGPWLPDSLVEWTRGEPPRARSYPGRRERDANGPERVEGERRFFERRERAQSLRITGDHAAAAEAYLEALREWPGHGDCLYYLANCWIELGREAAALLVLERLVRFEPQSNAGWMQIGRLRLPGGDPALDDLDAARRAFERCQELNRTESRPETMLGVVALLEGRWDEARERLGRAARLNPESVEARWLYGRAAWMAGDEARAREWLERAHLLATQGRDAGASVTGEGDTESGRAMTSARGVALLPALERWKTVSQREPDPRTEYGEHESDR